MANVERPHLIVPGRSLWDEFLAALRQQLTCTRLKPCDACSDDYRHATDVMQFMAVEKGVVIDIDSSLAAMRRRGGMCDCRILDIEETAA